MRRAPPSPAGSRRSTRCNTPAGCPARPATSRIMACDSDGRSQVNIDRRHFLIMLPAAAIAWKYVLAGTPEASPNYTMTDHWWSMLIDIPKCIGCGNCVRACAAENDVPDGHFRTWVERYHVTDWHMESPEVISPDGGKEGFPAVAQRRAARRVSLPHRMMRASISSFPSCATTARIRPAPRSVRWAPPSSLRTAWCWWTRPTASAAPTACRPALTDAATSIRKRKSRTSARSAITGSPRA